MQKLASWFFNTVFLSNDGSTVIKIPQLTTHLIREKKRSLMYALEVHEEYLWDAIPQTDIKTGKISPRWYYTEQEYIAWTPLYADNLNEALQREFDYLLQQWIAMEKDKKLFFDLYWRNWVVHNMKQFFYSSSNIWYSNYILTLDQRIKYIDIWNLSLHNPLVRAGKVIRNKIYHIDTWKVLG